jgi:hypothetical protein
VTGISLHAGITPFAGISEGAGVSLFTGIGDWTPDLLFTGGQSGDWLIVDPDFVWADTAATTPASVDGLVARLDGQRGSSWIQATEAARPTLRKTGDFYWLEVGTAAGAWQRLDATASLAGLFRNVGGATISVAGRVITNITTANEFFTFTGGDSVVTLRHSMGYSNAAGSTRCRSTRLDGGGVASPTAAHATTTNHVATGLGDYAGNLNTLVVDGVTLATAAYPDGAGNTSDTNSLLVQLGGSVNGNRSHTAFYGALVIPRIITPGERQFWEAYMHARMD